MRTALQRIAVCRSAWQHPPDLTLAAENQIQPAREKNSCSAAVWIFDDSERCVTPGRLYSDGIFRPVAIKTKATHVRRPCPFAGADVSRGDEEALNQRNDRMEMTARAVLSDPCPGRATLTVEFSCASSSSKKLSGRPSAVVCAHAKHSRNQSHAQTTMIRECRDAVAHGGAQLTILCW